jgi:hypothetical protein
MVLNMADVFLFVVRLWLVFSSLHRTAIVDGSYILTKAVGNNLDQFELLFDYFSVCFSAFSVIHNKTHNPSAPQPKCIAASMLRQQPLLCLKLLPKHGKPQPMTSKLTTSMLTSPTGLILAVLIVVPLQTKLS